MIEVIAEIAAQLAWRGPSGKPLGHIVLSREQAQTLVETVAKSEARVVLPPSVPTSAV